MVYAWLKCAALLRHCIDSVIRSIFLQFKIVLCIFEFDLAIKKPEMYSHFLACSSSFRLQTHSFPCISFPSSICSKKDIARCQNIIARNRNARNVQNLFDISTESGNNEEGPIELPQDGYDPFDSEEQVTPLQMVAGYAFTGGVAFLLYRLFQRRAKQAKEQRLRSSGLEKKDMKSQAEEALKALKSKQKQPLEVKDKGSPSVVQTFLGAVIAGVISYFLYNFSVNIESVMNKIEPSSNYSIRQITITVRTIIIGVSYLATFVFTANAVGLTLYSGELARKSLSSLFSSQSEPKPVETSEPIETESKVDREIDENQ